MSGEAQREMTLEEVANQYGTTHSAAREWRALVDERDSLRAQLAVAQADVRRLDWLDGVNAATNARNGTIYGWRFEVNCNRAALTDHNLPALSVREAIDFAITRTGEPKP